MGTKFENVRVKAEEAKPKWKERKDKFRQEHPKLSDCILKAEVFCGALIIWGIPIAFAYSQGRDDEKVRQMTDEVERSLDRYREGPNDFIDRDGQFHQDIGYGAYAVWPSKEAYLEAESKRVNDHIQILDL